MLKECTRMRDSVTRGDVNHRNVRSLITQCSATMSSHNVAEKFLETVLDICRADPAYASVCSATGVIQTVVAAIAAHGSVGPCYCVAELGCSALSLFTANGASTIADEMVLSMGAVDVVCSLIGSLPRNEKVVKPACMALFMIASSASPRAIAALRSSAAVDMLTLAKREHPADGFATVKFNADQVLAMIVPNAKVNSVILAHMLWRVCAPVLAPWCTLCYYIHCLVLCRLHPHHPVLRR